MKKILILMLIAIMSVSLVIMGISCKEEAAPEEETVEEEAAPAVEEAEEAEAEEETEEVIPDGGELHMGFAQMPHHFNLLAPMSGIEQRTWRYVFDTLLKTGQDGIIIPGLSEMPVISDDGLEYILNLRDDVLWHDNEPFDADDVVFSFNYSLNPAATSAEADFYSNIKGYDEYVTGEADSIEGVEKIDDYTVKITLLKADNLFIHYLAASSWVNLEILPEHVLSKIAPEDFANSDFATKRLYPGTGAFIFEQYVPEQYIELTRNTEYWGGCPHIEKLYINVFLDEGGMYIALEKGEIDMVRHWSMTEVDHFKSLPNFTVTEFPSGGYVGLAFNCGPNGTIPLLVRQAIAYAIDRDVLVNDIREGGAISEYRQLYASSWANSPDLNPYDYNPEKAKSLLEEAEWDYEKEINILCNEATAEVTAIQKWMRDIGLNVNVSVIDQAGYTEKTYVEGDYDMAYFGGLGGGFDPYLDAVLYHSDPEMNGGWSISWYNNPELDALIEEGQNSRTLEEREPIYQEISEILNRDLPTLPLVLWKLHYIVNNKVKNVTWEERRWDNIQDWYIEE